MEGICLWGGGGRTVCGLAASFVAARVLHAHLECDAAVEVDVSLRAGHGAEAAEAVHPLTVHCTHTHTSSLWSSRRSFSCAVAVTSTSNPVITSPFIVPSRVPVRGSARLCSAARAGDVGAGVAVGASAAGCQAAHVLTAPPVVLDQVQSLGRT